MLESVARQSKVLKDMLDTCASNLQSDDGRDCNSSMEGGSPTELRTEVEEEVPLPTIHSDHLKIVVRSEKSFQFQSGKILLESKDVFYRLKHTVCC